MKVFYHLETKANKKYVSKFLMTITEANKKFKKLHKYDNNIIKVWLTTRGGWSGYYICKTLKEIKDESSFKRFKK